MTPLPVDALLPKIVASLRRQPNLVLEAPPGSGKTTRVPPALLSLADGDVLVLEPRRLAVRMAARRVAFEHGERLGETVGYQVRFEEASGPRTRLRFLTEGVLTRRLLSDPQLSRAGVVVLDEFHERHLDTDLALALLRRLQQTARPDLGIVVMSATLSSDRVARFLGDCPVLRSEGKLFDLSISYTPSSTPPLEEQVAAALETLLSEGLEGDVLVFLPGAAEIRRAARTCAPIAERAGLLIAPLYGDLSSAEQDRAVLPASRCKVILSTNIAESSVTIEGVRAVIDSGLARIASDSPWSGLPSLQVGRISKASATQRAGRAGRTGPGRVIRLYPAEDFHRRREYDAPEIVRRELTQLCLDLRSMDIENLEWLDNPPEAALDAATELLRRLDAIDDAGRVTELGRRMAALPLHPRLARLVLEAKRRNVLDQGCAAAATLSAGERIERIPDHAAPSDLLPLIEREWQPQTQRVYDQIRRVFPAARRTTLDERALLISVLTAFPDRLARRRQANEVVLASGGSALLAATSAVRDAAFLVTIDIEERRERGLPLIRLASAVEPDWLLDLFPQRVEARSGVEWNRTAERVEAASALLYDGLTIEESRGGLPDPDQAARLLAEKAIEAGLERFVNREQLDEFRARLDFASAHSSILPLTDKTLQSVLTELCSGRRGFAELAAAGLLEELKSCYRGQHLDEIAPERLRLPGGRSVKVRYVRNQAPSVASRLQDFFGMKDTPRIAGVPLVIHLLAPNQRPVQMTTDLAGFWERLYPQVRRELSRRYPRHAWPEKP